MKHKAFAIAALSGLVVCFSASGSDDSVQEALKDYAFATCLISQCSGQLIPDTVLSFSSAA